MEPIAPKSHFWAFPLPAFSHCPCCFPLFLPNFLDDSSSLSAHATKNFCTVLLIYRGQLRSLALVPKKHFSFLHPHLSVGLHTSPEGHLSMWKGPNCQKRSQETFLCSSLWQIPCCISEAEFWHGIYNNRKEKYTVVRYLERQYVMWLGKVCLGVSYSCYSA